MGILTDELGLWRRFGGKALGGVECGESLCEVPVQILAKRRALGGATMVILVTLGASVPRSRSGGGDLDFDGASHSPECFLYLADVGAVVRIGQLAYRGLTNAQPAGEFHFGDALRAHG